MTRKKAAVCMALLLCLASIAGAQEFGFGDTAVTPENKIIAPSVKLSGKIAFYILLFPGEIANGDMSSSQMVPDLRIKFAAAGNNVDGLIALRLGQNLIVPNPRLSSILDEAWIRTYLGDATLEAGLMRQTWGRADSLSVLDVVNSRDYTDLTVQNTQDQKVSNAMFHLTWNIDPHLSVEALYTPWFIPNIIASSGPWVPPSLAAMAAQGLSFKVPDTIRFDYGQAGARLNLSYPAIDVGLQYFFGLLPNAAYDMNPASIMAAGGKIPVSWNRYHQIGADMATVLWGFNLRSELGFNITNDIEGNDPLVYNPAFVWAFGFDRNLFWEINLNLQAMGKVRLGYDAITSPLDIEKNNKISSTQIAARLSRNFVRDTIKLNLTTVVDIEDPGFMISPGAAFMVGDAEISVIGAYFGGAAEGQLGQYHDKGYVQLLVSYQF